MTFTKMFDVWQAQNDFTFAINSFTDEFITADEQAKIEIIATEPVFNSSATNVQKAELAALIEDLCLMFDMQLPGWCNKPDYFLDILHYAWNATKKEHQEYLCSVAPPHFRKRGLCYPSNAFSRT